ncbi:TPA: 3D domain-containing protein [Bacillus cereus]|uniref:3D domain-containing protein n=1 Tax=unclassified Bacillus cereus group TaxID=2750818 RepID=UPI00391E4B40
MDRTKVAVWVFALTLLLVVFPLGISEIKESKETISTLENDLLREKAAHKTASGHYQQEKAKVDELNSQVNALEDELGNARAELGEAQQEVKAAKEEAATALAEVEKLKKARASAVKKPPVQREKAKSPPKEEAQTSQEVKAAPAKAEEPSGDGGRKQQFRVTAYGADCAGCQGKTASGTTPEVGRTLACPPQYPFGTKIKIPELGGTFICEDRGGAIQGNTLDYFHGTSEAATSSFGVKYVEGIVYD